MPTSRNNKLYADNITSLERLRVRNEERLHDAAFLWNKLANDRSSELSKHLFTIASLALPLSLIPVTNAEIAASLSLESKSFLGLSWFLFVLSLIAGMIHLWKESNFFNDWAKQENERSHVFGEAIFTTDPVDAYNRFTEMNKQSTKLVKMSSDSDRTFLYWQEGLLIAGVVMIGMVLALRLFQPAKALNKHRDDYRYEYRMRRQNICFP